MSKYHNHFRGFQKYLQVTDKTLRKSSTTIVGVRPKNLKEKKIQMH